MNHTRTAVALFALAALAAARPTYTAYSGAPGTPGTCAATCHGSAGGTITVTGFPTTYVAGQAYVVSVVHRGGSSINNFNASVRRGTGAMSAGTVTAGYRTATYSASPEPMGVHLSSDNQDSATFTWTAPNPTVGAVRLYLAGHQQTNTGGPNSTIVLVASDGSGIEEARPAPARAALSVRPSVARGRVTINCPAGETDATILVIDRYGRIVARIPLAAGAGMVEWQPLDRRGRRLPAGNYFVVHDAGRQRSVCRLTIR